MDFQPKTESGSPHPFASGIAADDTTYMNMSISELISKLRATEVVKSRLNSEVEEKKREINSLKERVKFETLDKRRVEVELKQRCKKGKEAEERYEELLGVLRTQNRELGEELKKCKQQCEEGKKAEERYEKLLEAAKKMEQEHGSTIAELRSMIRKLEDENRKHEDIWKRKFGEFNERVSRLGNDIELLKNGGETNVVHVHGRQFGDISGGIGQSPRNPNKGASAGSRRLGSSQFLTNILDGFNTDFTSSSSSESSECYMEQLLSIGRGRTTDKRRKT